MVLAKNLLLSAALVGSARAAVIPQRRSQSDGPRKIENPILDISKITKNQPAPTRVAETNRVASATTVTRTKSNSKFESATRQAEGSKETNHKGSSTTTRKGSDESKGHDGSSTSTRSNGNGESSTKTSSAPPSSNTGNVNNNPPSATGGAATKGLLVQFVVPDDFALPPASGPKEAPAVRQNSTQAAIDFLVGAVPGIDREAATLSWFGADLSQNNADFLVFDTFADDAGRAQHLGGAVAASVVAQAPNFENGLNINAFDIITIKDADPNQAAKVQFGLHASFEAQSDKIGEVQKFCQDSLELANQEQGTINWLCGQWPGTAKFLILDSFVDEASLQDHLNGKIAANLIALGTDKTLIAPPVIDQLNIVAAANVKDASAVPPPPSGGGADNVDNGQVDNSRVQRASNSLTDTANFGLMAPFTAISNAADAVKSFVQGATSLAAAEPGTLQWFASSVQEDQNADFLIFDTFATAADRDAHLAGKVAGGLLGNIASLSSVDIIPFDVLAIKSLSDAAAVASATSGVTVGLNVMFNATSDTTVARVQQLCADGLQLIEQEQGTLNWICAQIPGTLNFVILDSFASDADRDTHLNGKFVAGLKAAVGNLINEPIVQKLDIFAGTSKPDAGAGNAGNGNAATPPPPAGSTDGATETATGDSADPTLNPIGDAQPVKLVKIY